MNALEGKRILITGASGFTGRHLIDLLRRHEAEVFEAGFRNETAGKGGIDLTDRESIRSVLQWSMPEYVIHLAAISFVGHGDQNEFFAVNTVGTDNLLREVASIVPNVTKILVPSSANVYGNTSAGRVSEREIPAPVNTYAISKTAMEYMVRTWTDRLPLIVFRPFNYTGLGQADKFVVPKIVAHFLRRAPTIDLGNIDVIREFNDVRFVSEVYAAALLSDKKSITSNLCSGIGYSLREIIKIMGELTGHSLEIRTDPNLLRANEIHELVGDPDFMRSSFGIESKYTLHDTLRWMSGL